jgi:hypothetical protein
MLLALIPVIWLAIAGFVVALCRGAADADAVLHASSEHALAQGQFAIVPDPHAHPRASWRRPEAAAPTRRAARKSAGQTRGTRVGR